MTNEGIFTLKGSIGIEIKRYKLLVKNDIDKSKNMYKIGEQIILLASKGEYAQFIRFTSTLDKEDLLIYFVAKALVLSLVEGHLMISNYILDNGYPTTITTGLPNVMHDCLKELLDYQCVSIISLLVSKGFNVNQQEKGTWLSALHLAIQRMLVKTVNQLIELGADVNIVAKDDLMPLTLANQLIDCSEKHEIIQILMNSGAKETWRRDSTTFITHNNSNSNYSSSLYDSSTTSLITMNTQIKATPSISTISTSFARNPSINKENNIKYVRFTGNTNPSIQCVLYHNNELKPKVTVYNGNGDRHLKPPPKVNREINTNNNLLDEIDNLKISNTETDDIIYDNNQNNMNDTYESVVIVDINNNDSKLLETSNDGAFLFTTG